MNNLVNTKKIYVTKYALTEGVFSVEAEVYENISGMATYQGPGCDRSHVHGKDWWLNKEDALNRAEEMRKNKIKSMNKSIEKLESKKFEVIAK